MKKLSDISTDHRGTYNNFQDKDCYAIGKHAAIHGTAGELRKFKNTHPHYRLTKRSVRTMRDKYRRTAMSSQQRRQLLC